VKGVRVLKLAGRTAVVTGAAGGIGRGIALALARRGCHVALADIDEAALARTTAEIAGRARGRCESATIVLTWQTVPPLRRCRRR
jgi:NAD(P)-dependent dehydrogenase (short-subunit alcohol dehydrogenase family)